MSVIIDNKSCKTPLLLVFTCELLMTSDGVCRNTWTWRRWWRVRLGPGWWTASTALCRPTVEQAARAAASPARDSLLCISFIPPLTSLTPVRRRLEIVLLAFCTAVTVCSRSHPSPSVPIPP